MEAVLQPKPIIDRFESMPMGEYQDSPGISKSKLDLLHRSPAHYRQELLEPSEPTDAMRWGSMFHSFILEPEVFNKSYAVLEEKIDKRTKEGKAIWEEWQAAHPFQETIDKPTMTELVAMRDSIYSHPAAQKYLTGGIAEQCMFWERNGILCKARPDYIVQTDEGVLLVDLKTTKDARMDEFARACWSYRYHVQAPYYMDGYEIITGEQPLGFLFIAIEKAKPYPTAAYLANEAMVEQGRREYISDLDVYAECLAKDEWPGYPTGVIDLLLPRWTQEVI
jgi:hypothetical protein